MGYITRNLIIFCIRCHVTCDMPYIYEYIHSRYISDFALVMHVGVVYSISQEICTQLLLCCALLWLYIDWFFPYPTGLLHWHCGNLTIAPVPAKQPWWIWINTSCEFIMNDCITTTKQSTTKPCAYFLGYTVYIYQLKQYCSVTLNLDAVIKWKHFPRNWPIVRGIHRSLVDSPHKGQRGRALMFSLMGAWTNGWVNSRDVGDLRRHGAHCGVTVMSFLFVMWCNHKVETFSMVILMYMSVTSGGWGLHER